MQFSHAITRKPGEDFAQGITTAGLGPPDYARMLQQHTTYVENLQHLGLDVAVLDPLPGYPDAYFVEDVAVVTPEVAVITRPGTSPRCDEISAIEPVLARHRPLQHIQPPGTIEGGDVMIIEDHVFIGISQRTNHAGAEQLGQILAAHGYSWTPVPVIQGLHLKSSVTYAGKNTLLITESFSQLPTFENYRKLIVKDSEAYASNILLINNHLIIPKGFPNSRELLGTLDLPLIELEMSETRKMDGALTCLSLRF